jgi:hypothetical protein
MNTSLRSLATLLEDEPQCGTRPPHWPPFPPKLGSLADLLGQPGLTVEINPQPLPPRVAAIRSVLFQQVRLFQLAQLLEKLPGGAAELGAQLGVQVSEAFDGTCGSVPLSVLIQYLLSHGGHPPPPPPWLQQIENVVSQLQVAARVEGAAGVALQQAGLSVLKAQFAGFAERQATR